MKFLMGKRIFVRLLGIAGVLLILLVIAVIRYWCWSPGSQKPLPAYPDNAIWLERGWLGDDGWFRCNSRNPEDFRSEKKITALLEKLRENHISVVFPKLGSVQVDGQITSYDDVQLERFLDCAEKFKIKVIPYILGVLNTSDCVEDEAWRKIYIASVVKLLTSHPRLAGVQINFEPWPYDKTGYLSLLDELRSAIPGKIFSVAVYSPRTKRQPYSCPYWPGGYRSFIAERCDLMAVMLFRTSILLEKYYVDKMTGWTNGFAGMGFYRGCKMILGVSASDDFWSWEHSSRVENLSSALRGISASPDNHWLSGIAIYGEEEMDEAKWQLWRKFIR